MAAGVTAHRWTGGGIIELPGSSVMARAQTREEGQKLIRLGISETDSPVGMGQGHGKLDVEARSGAIKTYHRIFHRAQRQHHNLR